MKLVSTAKRLETNAEIESQNFGIGDASVVIEILRNRLYRHKIRTLVQEYISNGRDAMREAKSTGKLEVTLPTQFNPTFKVRDYGIGVNPKRMSDVFIMYGASTKRTSNNQTGGFGIGAKSAWAYTDSFTIVTYIKGIQRSYVAHTGANNNGRLDYLGETATAEKDGTEIQIPVSPKDVTEFRNSAYRAVHFWDKNEQPTFKGAKPDDKWERITGERLGDLEVLTQADLPRYVIGDYDRGVVLSIDGIPYLAGDNLIDKVKSLRALSNLVVGRLVLHVPNGVLEVSASREEIADSKVTLQNLSELGEKAHKAVKEKINKAFSKAKTPFEHLSVYTELQGKYDLSAYTTVGDFKINHLKKIESDLFSKVEGDICTESLGKLDKVSINKTNRRRYGYSRGIDASQFNSLFYTDGTESAVIVNYRIRAWLEKYPSMVVFKKLANDAGEFDKVKAGLGLKNLNLVPYTKPARKPREVIAIERTKKEFCIHDLGRYSHKAKYITLEGNSKKWLYIEKSENDVGLRDLASYLEDQGFNICALSKDALSRVSNDKNFKPLKEFLKNYKPTARDIANLKGEIAKNKEMTGNLNRVEGIKNKFLNKMIAEYATHRSEIVPEILKKAIGKVDEVEEFKENDKLLSEAFKTQYPLLNSIYWNGKLERTEIVFYINSK